MRKIRRFFDGVDTDLLKPLCAVTLYLLGVLLVITSCFRVPPPPPVTVVAPSSPPWACDPEPQAPFRPGAGSYRGPGRVVVTYPDEVVDGRLVGGPVVTIERGWGVAADDLAKITDYGVALRAAYRSCRAVVDEVNRLNRELK